MEHDTRLTLMDKISGIGGGDGSFGSENVPIRGETNESIDRTLVQLGAIMDTDIDLFTLNSDRMKKTRERKIIERNKEVELVPQADSSTNTSKRKTQVDQLDIHMTGLDDVDSGSDFSDSKISFKRFGFEFLTISHDFCNLKMSMTVFFHYSNR